MRSENQACQKRYRVGGRGERPDEARAVLCFEEVVRDQEEFGLSTRLPSEVRGVTGTAAVNLDSMLACNVEPKPGRVNLGSLSVRSGGRCSSL